MKDRTGNGIGADGQNLDWELINWHSIENSIRKLRQRLFRATKEQRWNQVRSLMKLLLRSYSNLLLSVRLVTQINKGRRTAGIDNQRIRTPEERTNLVRDMMQYKPWLAKPARRIYIPKANSSKLRPLGIPVIRDRVAQAIVKNALEPSWEARFEPNNYGFRPGRSCHDAVEQCWRYFNKRGHRVWVLDADILGAFDNISHSFILDTLGQVPGRELVKQWLKAGYVEDNLIHATTSGTPQGGIISPLLLNIALHGLEELMGPRYGFVRYADDFIVCARTREEVEYVQPQIEGWLHGRGLALHPEKTRIVHVDNGFNFLSFSIRRFGGKCLIQPQKEKVLAFLSSVRLWLSKHRQSTAADVVRHLNPILRGWSNYYRHAVSKRTFSYVSHRLWQMLWKWCLRRHPKKGKHWVFHKYFQTDNPRIWSFHGDLENENKPPKRLFLFDIDAVAIKRHIKVRGSACPDDSSLNEYWRNRRQQRLLYPTKELILEA